jgi:uncharacterized protein YcbK (DUF882 family)
MTLGGLAHARAPDKSKASIRPPSKAARARLAGRTRARIGKLPPPIVTLHYARTREIIVLDRKAGVKLPQPVLERYFRCTFTDSTRHMDPRLPGVLGAAALKFDKERIEIVSGFRAPKYNLILRKKGHQVARDSQHTHGNAVDFYVPGVPTRKLRDWAWALVLGGVGYYPKSGFVHVDTGRRRRWNGD